MKNKKTFNPPFNSDCSSSFFALFFLGVLLFSGISCTTSALKLKRDPGDYIGKKVRVSGIIIDKRTVPLTDFEIYEISDHGFPVMIIREGKKDSKGLYYSYCAKGDVYYIGSDDPRAKSGLRSAIKKKIAKVSAGTILAGGSDQIAAALAELLEYTDKTGRLQDYPPTVVIVED
jgi:hypothetical protein